MKTLSKFAVMAGLALFALSCNQEAEVVSIPSTDIQTEEAFPGRTGEVVETSKLSYEIIDGQYILDGDIILSEEQVRTINDNRGAGLSDLSTRWPNNTMYYTIDPSLPSVNQTRVADAMAHWEANTNMTFVPRTNQVAYVEFRPSTNSCSSSLGMTGYKQYINLATGCGTGTTIHEIGHAAGLYHEQSRSDRDANVTIHWDNISPGYEHNFRTYVETNSGGFDHGAFDFNSIMMYSPYSFSSNGQPTITLPNGSTYSVQRNGLSLGDIGIIDQMYPGTTGTVYNDCPGATITANAGSISVDITASGISYVKIFNSSWQSQGFLCTSWSSPNCTNGLNTSMNLAAGTYIIQVESSNGTCTIQNVVVGSGPVCTDNDNDGLCAEDDCDDNDASVAGPGSACDDNNPSTNNDMYDANCVCVGTPIVGCMDYNTCAGATITACEGSISVEVTSGGLSYVKVFNSSWQSLGFLCTSWSSPNCTTGLNTSMSVPAGTYHVQVQSGSTCTVNNITVQ